MALALEEKTTNKGVMVMEKYIIVKTQFEGFHCWPNAPTEVMFLRNSHRHIFYVVAKIPITSDRQLEFFIVKKTIDDYIKSIYIGPDASCESIAENIAKYIQEAYQIRTDITVQVFEDNENGAEVHI